MFVNNNLSVSPPWPRTEEGQKSYLIIWKQYLPSWEDCSQWGFIFTINIRELDNKYPGLVLSSLFLQWEVDVNCKELWLLGYYLAWLNSPHHICQVTGNYLHLSHQDLSCLLCPLHCWITKCHWTDEFYERSQTKGNYSLHKQAIFCLSRYSRLYDLQYTIQLCLSVVIWPSVKLNYKFPLCSSDIQLFYFSFINIYFNFSIFYYI